MQTRFVSLDSISSRVDYGLTASATEAKTRNKFLRITDIREERIDWKEVPYCQCSHEDEKKYKLRTGDIVFARTGSVGNSCLITGVPEGAVFASYLIRIRPKREIVDSVFLSYFFRTPDYWRQIMGAAVGAIHLGLNATKLKQLAIPLPPLPEQQRIAAVLSKADRLRRLRRTARELSDTYLQSVFLETFGDPVSNPMGWETGQLHTLCSEVVDCPHSTPKYAPDTTPYACIRSSDIQNGFLDWSTTKYVDFSEYEKRIERTTPIPGDVIYCREGARFGNAARITTDKKVCLGQRTMLFRANPDVATSEFIWEFLESDSIYQQIADLAGGSASPHVNVRDIKALTTIIPPIPLQQQFAHIVHKFERLRVQQREAERQSEHLFQTLLQGAFREGL